MSAPQISTCLIIFYVMFYLLNSHQDNKQCIIQQDVGFHSNTGMSKSIAHTTTPSTRTSKRIFQALFSVYISLWIQTCNPYNLLVLHLNSVRIRVPGSPIDTISCFLLTLSQHNVSWFGGEKSKTL